jgi:hypothetical protein
MSTAPALRLKIQELRDDVSAEGEALVARWEPWIVRRDFAFSAPTSVRTFEVCAFSHTGLPAFSDPSPPTATSASW